MKKTIFPLIYVGEWILFFYLLIFVFVFNMTYFANMLIIDIPWEEPITLPFINSLLFVLCIGTICFFYIKYLTGNRTYKKIKEFIWAILLGVNILSCILWFSLSYSFSISTDERILLIIVILVSIILAVQVIKKYRKEN